MSCPLGKGTTTLCGSADLARLQFPDFWQDQQLSSLINTPRAADDSAVEGADDALLEIFNLLTTGSLKMNRIAIVKPRRQRPAFSLIEVMLVLVVLGIVIAVGLPQMSHTTLDARERNALYNLHTIRSMIDMYQSHHDGASPRATLVELVSVTDGDGVIGFDEDHPFGPYLSRVPENPFNKSATVAQPATIPPTSTILGAGWLYDPGSGQIWINHSDYLSE